jgi:hypothetical protein
MDFGDFLTLTLIIVGVAISTFIFQYAWNYTMPKIFSGVGSLDFLQAFFLLIVARILIPNCPVVGSIFSTAARQF